MPLTPFALALKRLMQHRGFTVVKLARKTGMSRNTIHRYLSGWYGEPTLKTVRQLSKGLGVSPAAFFAWENSEEVPLDDDLFAISSRR